MRRCSRGIPSVVLLSALAANAGLAMPCAGQTFDWRGGTGNWLDPDRWSPSGFPVNSASTARFSARNDLPYDVRLELDLNVGTVSIDSPSATVRTLNNNLVVWQSLAILSGALDLGQGSSLTAAANSAAAATNAGLLTLRRNASFALPLTNAGVLDIRDPDPAGQFAALQRPITNTGLIRLRGDDAPVRARLSALLDNRESGLIEVLGAGAIVSRTSSASISSSGRIDIADGSTLVIDGNNFPLTITGGTVRGNLRLVNGARLDHTGGELLNPPLLISSHIRVGPNIPSPITYQVKGPMPTFASIGFSVGSPLATVRITGGTAVTDVGASNRGTIILDSDVADLDLSSGFALGSNFVNHPGGVIRALPGAGGHRQISGSGVSRIRQIVNRGLIEAAPGTRLWITGHYIGDGGALVGDIAFVGNTIVSLDKVPDSPQRLVLSGSASLVSSIPWNVEVEFNGVSTTQRLPQAGVNRGVLRLRAVDSSGVRVHGLSGFLNAHGAHIDLAPGPDAAILASGIENRGLITVRTTSQIGSIGNSGTVRLMLDPSQTLFVPNSMSNLPTGVLEGHGRSDIVLGMNSGRVAPGGHDIGAISIRHLVQDHSGTVEFDIRGHLPAIDHDRLICSASAELRGHLLLRFDPAFSPAPGDSFRLLDASAIFGRFTTVTALGLPAGLRAVPRYASQSVEVAVLPVCPADFNNDGPLDPDDLGDFLNCFFALPPCPRADFNADGQTTPDDLGDFLDAYFAGCP